MLSPKPIKLVAGLVLAASSLIFVIATYPISDAKSGSQGNGPALKSKILRRKDRLGEKPNAYEKAWLRKHATAQEERKFEDKIPSHVPIKVKLKADKEKKFKDLSNPTWFRDFELEVKNTSNKPIYYLNLWLVYPEVISESGRRVGVVLRYGRMDFVDFNARPIETDTPILPGATVRLLIPEQDQKGWLSQKIRKGRSDPKIVEITLTQICYGDGTGFNGRDARPYPYRRELSWIGYCRETSDEVEGNRPDPRSRFPALFQTYSGERPAAFLPVNFFRGKSSTPDLCCPGTDCSWKKNKPILAFVGLLSRRSDW